MMKATRTFALGVMVVFVLSLLGESYSKFSGFRNTFYSRLQQDVPAVQCEIDELK